MSCNHRCDSFVRQFRDPEKQNVKDDGSDIENKPKKTSSGFLKDYLIDYTANSNLHGLRYIGESERTFLEK